MPVSKYQVGKSIIRKRKFMDDSVRRIDFLSRMVDVDGLAVELLPFDGMNVVRQTLSFSKRFQFSFLHTVSSLYFCGIDPGQVNMGMATLAWSDGEMRGEVFQIALPTKEGTLGTILNVGQVVSYVLGMSVAPRPNYAVVENAAYGAPFGQAALATARTTAIITLLQSMDSANVDVPPPASIRKTVFLNGKMKADVVWPFLGKDAAAALSCALYQFYKEN